MSFALVAAPGLRDFPREGEMLSGLMEEEGPKVAVASFFFDGEDLLTRLFDNSGTLLTLLNFFKNLFPSFNLFSFSVFPCASPPIPIIPNSPNPNPKPADPERNCVGLTHPGSMR